jgi:hypothetical protein
MIVYKGNVVEYLKRNLKKGYTEEALRWALVNQGYSRSVVDASINQANKEMADVAPIVKEKPKITYNVYDEQDNPVFVKLKKPFWKRIFR